MLRVCTVFVLICLPLLATAGPHGTIRVIDADTWDVGSTRVRLFGIDAPELAQTCETDQQEVVQCGLWATQQVRTRYEGKTAKCEKIDTDRYNRTVARCRVAGKDVGRQLVADGLAFAYRQYSLDYDLDEKGAAINNRGLHAYHMQTPAQYRKIRAKSPAPPDHDCVIKGNISSKGVRIFHMPGQQHYGRTRINTAKGEKWFCTAAQARKSGWRQARR